MKINRIIIAAIALIAFTLNSCNENDNNSVASIKSKDSIIDAQNERIKELTSKSNNINENNNSNLPTAYNTKYVFAEILVDYSVLMDTRDLAMTSFHQTSVTNIIVINDLTEEFRYKLKDLIKGQRILDVGLIDPNYRISQVIIHDFDSYISASKAREEINYKSELKLSKYDISEITK